MQPVIKTEQLTKLYRSGDGIVDLTFTVGAGEIFGFLGPNGAGKTTTIRTLLDLLHPTGGSASIFGLDTRQSSLQIRSRLGNLPGEFVIDDTLTGLQLIDLFARIRGVTELSYAHTLADRFGADLGRPLHELSKGNRQKVGLIQAMFHNPELLLLDEPTSGLDPLMQEEFLTLLGEIRSEGRTVFISSHNLAEIERVCDRVGIIRDGRLIAVETVTGLTGKSFRRMSVTFAQSVDPAPFAAVPGVKELRSHDNELTFELATQSIDTVLKLAAGRTVIDMSLEHPTLEEAFLTYYGESAENGEPVDAGMDP